MLTTKTARGAALGLVGASLLLSGLGVTAWARGDANKAAEALASRAEERLVDVDEQTFTPEGLFARLVQLGFDPDPLIGTGNDFRFHTEITRYWISRCVVIAVTAGDVSTEVAKGDCDSAPQEP